MSANPTAGCCTGQTNSLCNESRKQDKTAGQKPSKSTRKSLLTGFLMVPLLLAGVLLGATPAFAVDPTPLPEVDCPMDLNAQCVANDVKTTLVSAEVLGNDDCTDGEIDLVFTVEYASNARESYDLAVFISKDGGTINGAGTALECAGAVALVGHGDPDTYLDTDADLFLDLDSDEQFPIADICGDLRKDEGPVQWTTTMTVNCFTPGDLIIESCRVWQQSSSHSEGGNPNGCEDVSGAGSGSKCDCEPLDFGPVLEPCLVTSCDDGNACTADICISDGPGSTASCENTDISASCDNGLYCDGAETCDEINGCEDGTPPDTGDGVGCTDDSCDEVNDVIVNDVNDGNCDNGLYCDGDETCDAVNDCQAGTAPSTDDGVVCTDDSCDEVNDVIVNTVNDGNCTDGEFCNGAETCDATNDCQAGTPPDPGDGVACTDDSCDEVNDVIVNTVNDGNCTDGEFCNGAETCDATDDCQDGTPPIIDDSVGCTDDSCDEVNDVIVNTVNDGRCTDGEFCNGAETCDATNDCQAGTPPDPDDGVGCTDDSCDEDNDVIVNTVNDGNCTDGEFCNGAETCDATDDCQDGTPPIIDDSVGCTDDSCDEVNDVIVNTVNDGNCTDGEFCNGAETCDATNDCQVGIPPIIDDGVACTDDSCDEVNDVIVNTVNDGNCTDGAFCNGAETCDATNDCQDGTPPCETGQCCTESSEPPDGTGTCRSPTLTVVKEVVHPENGMVASDFELGLNGETFMGSSGQVFIFDDEDVYHVSEDLTDQPAGDLSEFYTASFAGDCDASGDGTATCANLNQTCTVVNDDLEQQNQGSIQVSQYPWTYVTDPDQLPPGPGPKDGALVVELQGEFNVLNVSSGTNTVVLSNYVLNLTIRENGRGKFKDLAILTEADCTFNPPTPYLLAKAEDVDVTFSCDADAIAELGIDVGDVLKVEVRVNIFAGHQNFKSSFTQVIE